MVASRAAVLGTILRNPSDDKDRQKLSEFLVKFCTWEASTDQRLVDEARDLVKESNSGLSPKVLDCFAGGGSIPLEAMRVGCETYALELNPVAVIIELCTLVYPQKFGRPAEVPSFQEDIHGKNLTFVSNRLAYDVERWGTLVLEETRKQLSKYYPVGSDGSVPVAYLWARTLKCPNPRCGAEMPLVKQLWLSKDPKNRVALAMKVDKRAKRTNFQIASGADIDFDPKQGTIKLGSVQCPVCTEGILNKFQIKKAARESGFGHIPLAVVTDHQVKGRRYRLFSEEDIRGFHLAEQACKKLLMQEDAKLPIIPNEMISTDYDWVLKPPMFGLTKWRDLFTPRQLLAASSFVSKTKEVYDRVLKESGDAEYAIAVCTYLALVLSRMLDFSSSLSTWLPDWQFSSHVFSRQAIQIAWDYSELNPISDSVGSWKSMLRRSIPAIKFASLPASLPADVQQGSATRLPYDDATFDAVITDPPYYDSVPYSDLSDFFYVWLKRTVGGFYPKLFQTPLAPKTEELVEQSGKVTSVAKRVKDKSFYEKGIAQALTEVNRVLKPGGLCVVVFAHKTTTAWEKLISGILNAGFAVTSSWPMHTEMKTRLRAMGSAALASSVWLVCRRREPDAGVASWKSVQAMLDTRVKERLDYFLSQNIRGADALLSAIGPALEVFGKYTKVEKVTGDPVSITEFLDKVREVVAHHALGSVLSEQQLGNIDPETTFYVLWKWTYESMAQLETIEKNPPKQARKDGFKLLVPFDDALKLARSVGAEPETLFKEGLLKQEGENVRMLSPEERKGLHGLGELSRDGAPPTIIDMIHRALNLWSSQDRAKLSQYLVKSGAATNETFLTVAQSLSNMLPSQSREKQLLDGLLPRLSTGATEERSDNGTGTLDEYTGGEKNA